MIYLVDPHDGMRVKYAIKSPTTLVDAEGEVYPAGVPLSVGGPHCVSEAPDGSVWVALKASNQDEQAGMPELIGGGETFADRRSHVR